MHMDAARDQVSCSIHGNRQDARQGGDLAGGSSFARFLSSIDRITASLRFQAEGLIATVDVERRGGAQ